MTTNDLNCDVVEGIVKDLEESHQNLRENTEEI
jgi:hypothetical protein